MQLNWFEALLGRGLFIQCMLYIYLHLWSKRSESVHV